MEATARPRPQVPEGGGQGGAELGRKKGVPEKHDHLIPCGGAGGGTLRKEKAPFQPPQMPPMDLKSLKQLRKAEKAEREFRKKFKV